MIKYLSAVDLFEYRKLDKTLETSFNCMANNHLQNIRFTIRSSKIQTQTLPSTNRCFQAPFEEETHLLFAEKQSTEMCVATTKQPLDCVCTMIPVSVLRLRCLGKGNNGGTYINVRERF